MPKAKSYYIYTLGCQMNHSDSERFSSIIEGIGYQPTKNWKQADLVVFNTCSVKQHAEDRVTGMGKQIFDLKRINPELKVVISGCMARRTWRGAQKTKTPIQMSQKDRERELKKQMPWVDIIIETKDFGKLPQRLGHRLEKDSDQLLKEVGGEQHYLSFKPKYKNNFQAFVPISTGCDHFCTYCIVPFARGAEVCRTAESIITEVFNLILSGYRDITLLGQTVNRWVNPDFDQELKKGMIANTKIPELNTKPLSNSELNEWKHLFGEVKSKIDSDWIKQNTKELIIPKDFLQLIQVLDQIPGEWWTAWMSSHPNYMTKELIKFIGESSKQGFWNEEASGEGHQRPYLHFALQSGSDSILKRMNRRHKYSEFREVVAKMRKEIPNLAISTDMIVGFPKESEQDFQASLDAMQECRFDMAYISEYSPRKGTASALIPDDIPTEVKAKRKQIMNDEVLAKTVSENNQKLVGTERTVIVERENSRHEGYVARTVTNKQVLIKTENVLEIGSFLQVRITQSNVWSLDAIL